MEIETAALQQENEQKDFRGILNTLENDTSVSGPRLMVDYIAHQESIGNEKVISFNDERRTEHFICTRLIEDKKTGRVSIQVLTQNRTYQKQLTACGIITKDGNTHILLIPLIYLFGQSKGTIALDQEFTTNTLQTIHTPEKPILSLKTLDASYHQGIKRALDISVKGASPITLTYWKEKIEYPRLVDWISQPSMQVIQQATAQNPHVKSER